MTAFSTAVWGRSWWLDGDAQVSQTDGSISKQATWCGREADRQTDMRSKPFQWAAPWWLGERMEGHSRLASTRCRIPLTTAAGPTYESQAPKLQRLPRCTWAQHWQGRATWELPCQQNSHWPCVDLLPQERKVSGSLLASAVMGALQLLRAGWRLSRGTARLACRSSTCWSGLVAILQLQALENGTTKLSSPDFLCFVFTVPAIMCLL